MRRGFLVAVTAAAAIGMATAPAGAGGGNKVKAVDFAFKPKKVSVAQGSRVRWKNVEGRHTVTFKKSNYDKVIKGDDRVSKRFKRQGTFRYVCRFHIPQGMVGKVVVR